MQTLEPTLVEIFYIPAIDEILEIRTRYLSKYFYGKNGFISDADFSFFVRKYGFDGKIEAWLLDAWQE